MKRALVNYWVDMFTAAAFLICAVTGIARLFPAETVSISAGGQPVILGIAVGVWQTVHDWSGACMAAGVGVHTVLHLRWLAHMTRRVMRGDQKRGPRAAREDRRAPERPPTVPAAAPAPQVAADVELARLEEKWDERRALRQRRITRKTFLTGAAAVGGAALLVGVGLASRDATSSAGTASSSGDNEDQADGLSQSQESDAGSGSTYGQSGGGTGTGGGAAARVVVDSSICVGCGACVQVCPVAVFSPSGDIVTVQNPDACRLCGRCTQVCRPGAITLNS